MIAYYLGAVKRRAEQATGRELRDVVHGRPVHFVDNAPDADRKAEQTLREIAREVGFDDVTFQFEPIAAALDYERQIATEEVALIADIGGGTSDFSIVRLGPQRHGKADRAADILANDGVRIGGTDFDRQLSLGVVMPLFGFGSPMKRAGLDVPSSYFHDLATWSNINRMYEPRVIADIRQVRQEASEPELLDRLMRVVEEQRGHTLAMEVEDAKIALSDKRQAEHPAGMGRSPASTPASPAPIWSATPSNWPSGSRPASRTASTQARLVRRRHRRRVPDRRLGQTRPCPQGDHQGGAVGPHRRRRHLRRRRQGPDAGGAAALRAARLDSPDDDDAWAGFCRASGVQR